MFYVLCFLFIMFLNNKKLSSHALVSKALWKTTPKHVWKKRNPVKSNDFLNKRDLFPPSLKCNKPLVVAYDKLIN